MTINWEVECIYDVPHIHTSWNFKQVVFIINQNFNSDTEVKFKIFDFLVQAYSQFM